MALSGLIIVFAVTVTIGLTGCNNAPAVPPSHYTNGVLTGSYQNCAGCHQAGINGSPKEPASHTKYTNDQCLKCHKLSQ